MNLLPASFVSTAGISAVSPRKKIITKKRVGTAIFILLVLSGVVFGLRFVIFQANRSRTLGISTNFQTKLAAINREFSFAAYNADKKIADPIKYTLLDAQLTNRIVIKGQGATSANGRLFLILNLKLVNDTNSSKYINTRNYIRVAPKGLQDRLAPEIHNDTVEIQPLSTKLTRVGLAVNSTDSEFTLFVGEIEGEKEEINISF